MNKPTLQVNHGMYYVVISYKDEYGKSKQKWISTGLKEQGNKTKAIKKMKEIVAGLDMTNLTQTNNQENKEEVLFVDFLQSFLPLKKQQVEPVTYNSYVKYVETITKYFKNMRVKLKDLKPYHIEGFYKSQYDKGLSSNSVLKFHILIRECLQYALKNDFVLSNVADKVTRPKAVGYKANFYSVEEIEKLFEVIKDHECKLPIMLTAMYGLRRSEVLGLKWEAIDFENKLVKIQHKVLETKIDGKREIYKSDKLKNKTSNRVLPLLPQAEDLLIKQKEQFEKNKEQLGKCYDQRYLEYICVDNIGRLILPNRLTHNFKKILRKNNLRQIRFHDLRHSCASLMLSNGVPMKQIQEWLGHADFSTTANIYSHLDYKTKINSANTIANVFDFANQPKQEQNETEKDTRKIELEKELEELERKIREKEEQDLEYQEWKKEREERRKKKQSDMEM